MGHAAEMRVRVVREALEGLLAPKVASAILFEALEPYDGQPPTDAQQLLQFVRGPVREAMARRVGTDAAEQLCDRVETLLGGMQEAAAGPIEGRADVRSRASRRTTAKVAPHEGPLRLVVVSGGASMAQRLRAAMGPRISTFAVPDAQRLQAIAVDFRPAMVLVDATGEGAQDAGRLQGALGQLPSSTLTVVWGNRHPWASALVSALEQHQRRHAWLDPAEGVDPLIDLLRAQRG